MKIACFADEIAPAVSEQFAVMKQCGIRRMDLRSVSDTNVLALSEQQIRAFVREASANGIEVCCIASPIGKTPLSAPFSDAVEQTKHAARIAHLCGCRFVRCFSFYRENALRETVMPFAIERLAAMTEVAKREGIVLVLENAAPTVGDTGEACAAILDAVNSEHLRLVYDCAAFTAAGERPFYDSYPKVAPYIAYVHIKDGKRGESKRVVAGAGDAEIPELLDALRDRDDLILSLEPHLSFAGAAGGFSGRESFIEAHAALVTLLERGNIAYE